jgi:hypothetical protein
MENEEAAKESRGKSSGTKGNPSPNPSTAGDNTLSPKAKRRKVNHGMYL